MEILPWEDKSLKSFHNRLKERIYQVRRIGKISRERGYGWEKTLLRRIKKCSGWYVFRLGYGSNELPDLLALSNIEETIMAIECKMTTGNKIIIPGEQIERNLRCLEAFKKYRRRVCVLAFKFSRSKRIESGVYGGRELKEYYVIYDRPLIEGEEVPEVTCTYEGGVPNLPSIKMPFQNRIILMEKKNFTQ